MEVEDKTKIVIININKSLQTSICQVNIKELNDDIKGGGPGDRPDNFGVYERWVINRVENDFEDNNPNIEFVIVTDDPTTASKMLPNIPIVGSAISEEDNQIKK